MTVKGIARKERKAAATAKRSPDQGWNIELPEGGPGFEIVRERTPREEARHAARMERWARSYEDRP